MQSELLNPRCVERPGFLWFKVRSHEPLERLWLERGSILHVLCGASPTHAGHVEHFVACVCRHCYQPYITRYYANPISWSTWEEEPPERANEIALEACAKWEYRQEWKRKNESPVAP